LVLSLPTALPGRAQLVVMIFGTVMFSLLAQGLTISPLLKWLRFAQPEPRVKEYELLQGQLLTETAALAELDSLRRQGLVTERLYQALQTPLSRSHQELSQHLAQLDAAYQAVEQQQHRRLQRHLIDVKKARLAELQREGILSEPAYRELNQQLDENLAALQNEPASTTPQA